MTKATKLIEIEKPSALVSPIFSEGMVVSASDLNDITQYTVDLQRAVNRAVFGFGIVEGFEVTHKAKVATISKGLAIDPSGYPIVLEQDCDIDLSTAQTSHSGSVLVVERQAHEEEHVAEGAIPTGIATHARDVVRFCFSDKKTFETARTKDQKGVAVARLKVTASKVLLELDPTARDIAKIALPRT